VIGIIGGVLYLCASSLMVRLKIDDPLDAFAVHGIAGFWGLIATGLFAVPQYSYNGSCGAFYGCGETIVANLLGGVVQVCWVSVLSLVLFIGLKKGKLLRIPKEEEEMGIDISKHGGQAYTFA